MKRLYRPHPRNLFYRWDFIVCRRLGSYPMTRDVEATDNWLCALVHSKPRHRERWRGVLERMKGDWLACAARHHATATKPAGVPPAMISPPKGGLAH